MNSRMGRSRVSLYHDDRISNSIAGALDLLGDLSDIVRGKHVAVKPNDTWASADDLSACTQADTLETVIRYLKRLQPGRITVTGGAAQNPHQPGGIRVRTGAHGDALGSGVVILGHRPVLHVPLKIVADVDRRGRSIAGFDALVVAVACRRRRLPSPS
jgi:hypothetical protein